MSPKTKKELFDTMKFILSVVIIYFIFVFAFRYLPFLAKYDHYVIITDSMTPTINVGDIVVTNNKVSIDELKEEDIIAFKVDYDGNGTKEIVIHYLDEIQTNGTTPTYKTHPEVSDQQDPWTLIGSDIVGTYKFHIPYVGKFLLFFQSWVGRIVVIADIAIIYLAFQYILPKEEKPPKIKKVKKVKRIKKGSYKIK